ncbi:MAG: nitroreductase [Dehalococcoidia bacterium]|nr:nitroreductase [Dehalococcoidia bacterium]
MGVFEAVRTVLAVRSYQDRAVPAEVVSRIAEAARLTASSQNRQPWHFIVVEARAALRQLGALCTSGPYTADAAFAIVVGVNADSRSGTADAARAIQSMVLTAWEAGVGSNWVGIARADEVRTLLGAPSTLNLVAVVPFGYPARRAGLGKKDRKPLGEVVHRGRFGVPFA